MKKEDLFEALGEVEERYIEQAVSEEKKRRPNRRLWVGLAACLILAAAICTPFLARPRKAWPLTAASVGVTVKTIADPPSKDVSAALIPLSEEELFTYFDTAVFEGTVTSIENIEADFHGAKQYWAIAQIAVEKVWRGPLAPSDTAAVLLSHPAGEDLRVEDTETTSRMRPGTHGIFMPTVYGEDDTFRQNGATLRLLDLAPFGFADGVRYAFLETEDGLVFARSAYESIRDAQTLTEIVAYIEKMIP